MIERKVVVAASKTALRVERLSSKETVAQTLTEQ
jgi:hypothetical protein